KIKGLMEWDLNVNLPPKAGEERAAQVGYLAEKVTNLWYVPEFKEALEKAKHLDKLNLEEKAIVRNLSYAAKFYHKVPKELIIISQDMAQHLGYKDNPYDALLDLYEPELTASFCETTLGGLKKDLVTLLKKIQTSKNYTAETPLINGKFSYDIAVQKKLS